MGRPRKGTPTYRLHRQSGQAVVTVYSSNGRPRDILLGPYDSPESRAEYSRILSRLSPGNVLDEFRLAGLTVEDLIGAYWMHAKSYYVGLDGEPTSELREVRYSLKPLRRLFAQTPADSFTAKHLAQVREEMVKAGNCRRVVNTRTNRVRRAFKWALAEGLIASGVMESLRALEPLKAGRTKAEDYEEIKPVEEADYLATLKIMPKTPRAILELMRLTGMRPGEACRVTWGEVEEIEGGLWRYAPKRHKNAYRGQRRSILLGPKAQAVLSTHAARGSIPDGEPIFCAKRDKAVRMKGRETKRKLKKTPTGGYAPGVLCKIVRETCKRAKVAHWHPNQLRHLLLTEVRRELGLEAAQVAGGHKQADVTQIYAERDEAVAAKVAATR